jgi:hypothetical protein
MRDRARTQKIATTLQERGHTGLRWWSAFWGEWHTVVLFRDSAPSDALTYGQPEPVDITMPLVRNAARLLDIG